MSIRTSSIGTIFTPDGNIQTALVATTSVVLDCTAPGFDQQARDAVEKEFQDTYNKCKDRVDAAFLHQVIESE
ncbi:hypothetical protein TH9_12165 [Thalassospira xiamenensis]|uniref:hypothetical protein n=1 Tax=Thalassospira xiamenensis TaxID=220697 RepID=UPI000DEDE000|nr:hypothetical protein [Thalassospira xiamenensis]RCK32483.1 hypothetical protein TH9_12165 [Thalassospira xiamenensis]